MPRQGQFERPRGEMMKKLLVFVIFLLPSWLGKVRPWDSQLPKTAVKIS